MVVKLLFDKEKHCQKQRQRVQQQQQQLHPSECAQRTNKSLSVALQNCKLLAKKLDSDCRSKGRRSKNVPGSGSCSGTSSLAFSLLFLISFLSHLAHGAVLNSTLADDLLANSNNRSNDLKTSPIIRNETSKVESSTNSTTEVGSYDTPPTASIFLPDLRNEERSRTAATFNERSNRNETSHPQSSHENKNHIKLTIHVTPSDTTPIIVKHGNVIYEVNNGTVSTNAVSYAVPIVKAQTMPSRMRVFSGTPAKIIGLRVEDSPKPVSYEDGGASKILANHETTIRFFGSGFTNNTIIRFVGEAGERDEDCDDVSSTKYFHLESDEIYETSAVAKVQIPRLTDGDHKYYLCVREINDPGMAWVHQGTDQWIVITTYKKWLPVWAHIIMLAFLLLLSGLFSGLNLGLMAIDRTELRIIINAGSEQEKLHARKIQPLRDRGNFLLCSLLLGNVLVNATLTILLDDLTTGLIAVIVSTLGIVIFGEIVPQAVCSRHGLAIGANTAWITKIFMLLTFPMSYPISVILDKVLGEEIGNVYNRDRLKELIRVTQGENDLEKDEVNIISGALDLKQKTVVDVMTKLDDVYMLPIDSVLDFDTVSEIMSNGYSRIPVYEGARGNVISLLYTKDLAFVDPDDKMPLRTICEFYSNPCHFVFENVTLNVLFNVFKQGNKGHMAFVQRIKNTEKSDPTYEVIGLVTMEDVIEELIQEEINDETDVWGESENRRHSNDSCSPITEIAINHLKMEGTTVSPQLTLAAFQYLSTVVEEFSHQRISKNVLEKLLKQNIYFHIKIKNKESAKNDPNTILYERGKPADYFIMILEGRVIAEIGKENLVFESGPFSYFGTKSLTQISDVSSSPVLVRKISQSSFSESTMQPSYIPDYTVRAITDLTYFQISRSMYNAAKQATLLEKSYTSSDYLNNKEKIDEQSSAKIDEVFKSELRKQVNEAEGKSKEKTLALGKPTNRGSISERTHGIKDEGRKHGLTTQPTQKAMVMLGDNNNILSPIKQEENEVDVEFKKNNNMSHVIIIPKDEKPPDLIDHSDSRFPTKIIVGGEEKLTHL